MVEFYQVRWTPLKDVEALHIKSGLSDEDSMTNAALECEEKGIEDYKVYRLARRAAIKRSKECYWGSARIYTCVDKDKYTGAPIFGEQFQEYDSKKKRMESVD